MRGEKSNKRSKQDDIRSKLSLDLWPWIVVCVIIILIIILAVSIANLLAQVIEPPKLEDTNLSDEMKQDDTAATVELQLEEPITKGEFQQLLNDWSKEYLDFRIRSVDWWLAVVTIVLGFFAIVITVVGLVNFRAFWKLRDEAKQHVKETEEQRQTVSKNFQELRVETEQHVADIEEHRNLVLRDLQTIRAQAEQHIADIEEHRNLVLRDFQTFRDRFSEPNQEAGQVRQNETNRLDDLIFDIPSDNREFEELINGFRQSYDLSPLEESVLEAYTLQRNRSIEAAIERWHSIANIVEEKNNNLAAHAWKSIGDLYLTENRREEGLAAFDNAIQLKRDDAEVYARRGDVKSLLGIYESAITDYDDAIRLGANLEEMYSSRANSKNALDRYNEAIVDCNEAIRLNPNYARAYAIRGEAKNGSENFNDDASTDFQTGLELAIEQGQEELVTQIEQRLRELRSDGENL